MTFESVNPAALSERRPVPDYSSEYDGYGLVGQTYSMYENRWCPCLLELPLKTEKHGFCGV